MYLFYCREFFGTS